MHLSKRPRERERGYPGGIEGQQPVVRAIRKRWIVPRERHSLWRRVLGGLDQSGIGEAIGLNLMTFG